MNKPFFSIIIPLYNKEKSIARTLQGILNQSYPDFEIVVINDGSTDHSVDVVSQFHDERLHLYSQTNSGPSKARNEGVKHSMADWIVFLDADDEITPGALEYYAKTIREHPNLDILDCNKYNRFDDRLVPCYHPIEGWVKNNMKECFWGKISPGAGFSVFRKSLLERVPYDNQLRRFEDAEWLIRLLQNCKVYSSRQITSIHDMNYAAASNPRDNVMEDYFAYLDFSKGGFWQKMCIYRTFIENRDLYPIYGHQHYASLYRRYDLLLLYKLLNWIGKLTR